MSPERKFESEIRDLIGIFYSARAYNLAFLVKPGRALPPGFNDPNVDLTAFYEYLLETIGDVLETEGGAPDIKDVEQTLRSLASVYWK